MTAALEIARLIGTSGHTVDVERASISEDEIGGRERTWSTVAAGVAAWVQPASLQIVEEYGARRMRVTHSVFFAEDPSLLLGDRLCFGERVFAVRGVRNAGELDRLWRADCREDGAGRAA
jgi:hypothetical protein